MHQRTREGQFLLHSPRKGSGLALFKPLYLLINGLDAVVALLDSGAEKGGKELQVLSHREILIERKATGHIAHAAADVFHLPHRVETIHRSRSLVGQHQRAEDTEQGGLARTVGTNQPEHLSFADGERHIAESLHAAVPLAEAAYFNGIHSFTSPYIPIFIYPSLLTAILTAYTKSARSSSVRIVLGVNSERLLIQLTVPSYSLRWPAP